MNFLTTFVFLCPCGLKIGMCMGKNMIYNHEGLIHLPLRRCTLWKYFSLHVLLFRFFFMLGRGLLQI